jgi:hypothetical protein
VLLVLSLLNLDPNDECLDVPTNDFLSNNDAFAGDESDDTDKLLGDEP